MEDQEAYAKAKERVEVKSDFYTHLAVYVGVNILLIIINLLTSSHYLWFKWPLIGLSVGLLLHGLGVFGLTKGSLIKDRMIKKEMNGEADKKE